MDKELALTYRASISDRRSLNFQADCLIVQPDCVGPVRSGAISVHQLYTIGRLPCAQPCISISSIDQRLKYSRYSK